MEYLFASQKNVYEHFASGRVLYALPGHTAFPVRLASEIIQRCFHLLYAHGVQGPYTIYDPCCGVAYLLTTLGFLHRGQIGEIYASDIDKKALFVAEKNLSLLTPEGLKRREEEIEELYRLYQKESHFYALQSIAHFSELHDEQAIQKISCFQCDILSDEIPSERFQANIIIADLPYGGLIDWKTESFEPEKLFMKKVQRFMRPKKTLLSVISNQQIPYQEFGLRRLQRLKVGKRHIGIFRIE